MFDDWRNELAARDKERDYTKLNRRVINEAVASLRHLMVFHTRDVAGHRSVEEAHGRTNAEREFHLMVERYLTEHAIDLALRGPMPGIDSLGKRWAFRSEL